MIVTRNALLLIALVSTGAAVQAQDPTKNQNEYFPLVKESSWTYKVGEKQISVTVARTEMVDGVNCFVLETRDAGKVAATEMVTVKADGVYRVMFGDQKAEPHLKFLTLPPKAPAVWPFDSKIAGQKVAGKFTMSEEPMTVKVPFGEYKKVLKVASDGVKIGDQAATITYWFAPKVGMIKQEVVIGGVTITLELQKYEEKK